MLYQVSVTDAGLSAGRQHLLSEVIKDVELVPTHPLLLQPALCFRRSKRIVKRFSQALKGSEKAWLSYLRHLSAEERRSVWWTMNID